MFFFSYTHIYTSACVGIEFYETELCFNKTSRRPRWVSGRKWYEYGYVKNVSCGQVKRERIGSNSFWDSMRRQSRAII